MHFGSIVQAVCAGPVAFPVPLPAFGLAYILSFRLQQQAVLSVLSCLVVLLAGRMDSFDIIALAEELAESSPAPSTDAASPPGGASSGGSHAVLRLLHNSRNLGLSRRNSNRAAQRARQTTHLQQHAQATTFNRSGAGRTRDHQMVLKRHAKVRGKGRWKAWTPEAVLKAANSDPAATTRQAGPEGSGPLGPLHARGIQAAAICQAAKATLASIAGTEQLRFYITNNMMDETKLPIGKPKRKHERCLAWHSQVTWAAGQHPVQDVDVPRCPTLMFRYNAATMWSIMANPDDLAGLCPAGVPDEVYAAFITASDSHSANLLLSKFLTAKLGPRQFHVASCCTQHKAGSICEELGNMWKLLPPCFSLACQMEHSDFYMDLKVAVERVLDKYLVCSSDSSGLSPDSDCFEMELLEVCHVGHISNNDATEPDPRIGEAKRRLEARQFLEFFPPPWTGELLHPCRACLPGGCPNRADCVRKGCELVMQVIAPHITRPAANRYTKVFPVVCRIALMLSFFSLMKKAFRIVLRSNAGDSDDEKELQSLHFGNAGPGAYRRLQAWKSKCG